MDGGLLSYYIFSIILRAVMRYNVIRKQIQRKGGNGCAKISL